MRLEKNVRSHQKKVFKFTIGVIVAVMCVMLFWKHDMKIAVKRSELDSKDRYILVKTQMATVSEWIAVADEKGEFDAPKDVRILGNKPKGYNYAVETGDNTFVCYGKYISYNNSDEAGMYDIFYSDSWDIVFPIKRNSSFGKILPKTHLCFFDR